MNRTKEENQPEFDSTRLDNAGLKTLSNKSFIMPVILVLSIPLYSIQIKMKVSVYSSVWWPGYHCVFGFWFTPHGPRGGCMGPGLHASWTFSSPGFDGKGWVRERQCVFVWEGGRQRGEGQQTTLIDPLHPISQSTHVMCMAGPGHKECDVCIHESVQM